jgi:Winged helix-turn-helix DNA-binding
MNNLLVEQTIALIDTRISVLQTIKRDLIREFADSSVAHRYLSKGRRAALIQFLQLNGGTTRREIVEKTGIPVGTVSFLLNDKRIFTRSNGKWNLIEGNDSRYDE